jgi:hypothetical protein
MSTSPLKMDRAEIDPIVITECLRQVRDRRMEYAAAMIEAGERGRRMDHCIHGTRMVFADDRDAICGFCEESLTEAVEAKRMARHYVDDFVVIQASFDAALQAAVQHRIPAEIWYPMVAYLANHAIGTIQPVWPTTIERWVEHLNTEQAS